MPPTDVFERRAIAKFRPPPVTTTPPVKPVTPTPPPVAPTPPVPQKVRANASKRVFPMVKHDPVQWAAYLRAKFIAKSIAVHGEKYDYTESVHVDAHTKIQIRCPEHGLFSVQPTGHTSRGIGCYQCGVIKRREARQLARQLGIPPAPKVPVICKAVPKLDSTPFDQPHKKEPHMSISNRNGTITVQDVIRGKTIAQSYRAMNVYQARAAFAAYVRKTQGEVHYA